MQRYAALCLLLAMLTPGSAFAGPTAHARHAPQVITAAGRLGGASTAVALKDGFAFVGQSAEFSVLALADHAELERIAWLPVAANDIALGDNHAFVTNKDGITAIEVVDPAAPVQVGTLALPEALGAVAVAGDYAYATATRAGLYIVDIADPGRLKLAGLLQQPRIEGVAVQDGYAYLATSTGLKVVDVTDVRQPHLVGELLGVGSAEAVTVQEEYAYLTATTGGLLIVDIADPLHPVLAGAIALPTYTRNLQVTGETAYIANGNRGIAIVDVANAHQPRLYGVSKIGTLATDLAVAGSRIYVTDIYEGGLHVADGRDPANVTVAGAFHAPGVTSAVASQGNFAYLATGQEGDITVVEHGSLAHMSVVGSIQTPGNTSSLGVAGDRLYASAAETIEIFDLTMPGQPVKLHQHALNADERVIAIQENLSFVGDRAGVVHIYSTTAAGTMQEIGLFTTAGAVRDVAIGSGRLLVASGTQGVLAARFANNTQLAPAVVIDVPGFVEHVEVDGKFGYAFTQGGNLYILGLEGPGSGRVLGKLALGLRPITMRVQNGHAYFSAGERGIYVADVADARWPVLVGHYDTPGTALNVTVVDDTILVADGFAGLLVLTAHLPRGPQVYGSGTRGARPGS